MTVCIVAACDSEPCIVGVSDTRLSNWAHGSDLTAFTKVEMIPPDARWMMMFAGSPSVRLDVARRLRARLTEPGGDLADIVAAMESAIDDVVRVKIEREVLGNYGMHRERFLEAGLRTLGPEAFAHLNAALAAVTLETQFLVAGYDGIGRARIFSINHLRDAPKGTTHHDQEGCWAVGTGAFTALAILSQTYDPNLSATDLIFRLCEAKFLSESAQGVGERTIVSVIHRDGVIQWMTSSRVRAVRALWEKRRWPPVPEEAAEAITSKLETRTWNFGRSKS